MEEEKSQVEILCTEKIPRLLMGEGSKEVFGKRKALVEKALFESRSALVRDLFLENLRPCDETCPEYRVLTLNLEGDDAICEQGLMEVSSSYCRLGYSPIARSPPKCKDDYPSEDIEGDTLARLTGN